MGLETGTAHERDGSLPRPGTEPRRPHHGRGARRAGPRRCPHRVAARSVTSSSTSATTACPTCRARSVCSRFTSTARRRSSPRPVPATPTAATCRCRRRASSAASVARRHRRLVRAHRLVTLTGVGGVGKTRLAIEVGAVLAGEHPDGVWMVELAPLTDPAAVPDAIATTLGITPQAGTPVDADGGRGAARGAACSSCSTTASTSSTRSPSSVRELSRGRPRSACSRPPAKPSTFPESNGGSCCRSRSTAASAHRR